MSFIQTIPEDQATGVLREIYDEDLKGQGYVANHTKVMSLRPETIRAWRNLVATIRPKMRLRRYELVTIAAASAQRCTY